MLVTKALSQDVTNLAFVPLASEAAHRTPPGSFALCESEATALFYLCESETTATTKRPAGTEINHTL
ncbi:hypothetical protein [Lysinibacillus sp. TE18511]